MLGYRAFSPHDLLPLLAKAQTHLYVCIHSKFYQSAMQILTSHKKVFSMKTSTCRDGTLKNQPNKIGTTPQYFYTIPTSCAILPTMHCVCYLCAQKGCLGHGSLWNEQYWVCSARWCVVHVVVYGECVVLWVAVTLLRLSVAGMVS